MDRLFQDLTFALRLLWKDRAFSVTTLATLALCVAANTAIFAVVNSVILQPLPFDEPARLLAVHNAYPGAGIAVASNSVPDYFDRLRDVTAFEELSLYRESGTTVGGQGDSERVTSMQVSPSFFRTLRVSAVRGTVFTEGEAEPGNDRKVVLSYGLWQRMFGGREVVGQDVRLNGTPHTVVGVMPDTFHFINPEVGLWTPAAFTAEQRSDEQRHSNGWQQLGRLRAGASIEQVQSQLDALNTGNLDRFPQWREVILNAGFRTFVRPFHDELVADCVRRCTYSGVACSSYCSSAASTSPTSSRCARARA